MMRSISLLLNAVVCFIFITACGNQANPNNNTTDGWCADSYQICEGFCSCSEEVILGTICSAGDKINCSCWYKEGYGHNGLSISSTCGLYCADRLTLGNCKT